MKNRLRHLSLPAPQIPVDLTEFFLPIAGMKPRSRHNQSDPLDSIFLFEEETTNHPKLLPMASKAKPLEIEPVKKSEMRQRKSARDIPAQWPNGSAVFVSGKCDIGWPSRKAAEESNWFLGRVLEEEKVFHVWAWKNGTYRYVGEGEDIASALRLLD